jgi:putative ABC transport system permease protein
MSQLFRDLRFGSRMLMKRPGTSALAVVALALGIGLTTTMFSIVYAAFLRGLPFERANRILYVGTSSPNVNQGRPVQLTPHDFVDFRAAQTSFEELAGFTEARDVISDGAGETVPQRVDGVRLTPNALRVMRVEPIVGRGFSESDAAVGAPRVAIISHAIWTARYQQARDIAGRVIRLNGEPATIIGVMPEKFGFPQTGELWTPLSITLPAKRSEGAGINTFGRLRDGVSVRQASTEAAMIAAQLAQQYPENKNRAAVAVPFIDRFIRGQIKITLSTMLAAVFGVLLIACVNVTNLQLARAADRTKEVAVRLALGASRSKIVRQFLYEGLLLSGAGALLGLALGQIGIVYFKRGIEGTGAPFWIDVKIDTGALVVVMLLTVIAAIASSLVPALRVTRNALAEVLKDEGRSEGGGLKVGRFSRGLIVVQMTLSFSLLLASGLMVKSIANVSLVEYPFRTDVLAARVELNQPEYRERPALRQAHERLIAAVASVPGVGGVALSSGLPSMNGSSSLEIEGIPLPKGAGTEGPQTDLGAPRAEGLTVTPSFFQVMGLKVLRGRALNDDDREGSELVVVVSTDFANLYLGGTDPIGRRIRWDTTGKNPWKTIVGVVPSFGTRARNSTDLVASVLTPFDQASPRYLEVLVAPAGASRAPEGPVQRAIGSINPLVVGYDVNTIEGRFALQNWPVRVFGGLFMAVGASALFLASAGLYGVMAFAVRRRTSEIGVRMALGASQSNILQMVLKQGSWLVGIGMALGVGLGIGLGSLLTALTFNVKPWDPAVLGTTFAVLAMAGLVACLVPARRASAIDPLIALRRG